MVPKSFGSGMFIAFFKFLEFALALHATYIRGSPCVQFVYLMHVFNAVCKKISVCLIKFVCTLRASYNDICHWGL